MTKALVVGAIMLAAAAGPAWAAGDPEAGATIFKRCMACHSVGEGAKNKVGPELNDVFGRVAGSIEGFNYSQGLIDAGAAGLVWTPETIVPWLHKPKDVVPTTRMSFAGLADQADIDNVIAYLLTFSPNYVPAAPSSAPAN
jgi:cytochrome c